MRLEIAQVMMGTLEERALQLQRQRRAKEREKLAEAAASVPSGGGEAPPKKSAKVTDGTRLGQREPHSHTHAAATHLSSHPVYLLMYRKRTRRRRNGFGICCGSCARAGWPTTLRSSPRR